VSPPFRLSLPAFPARGAQRVQDRFRSLHGSERRSYDIRVSPHSFDPDLGQKVDIAYGRPFIAGMDFDFPFFSDRYRTIHVLNGPMIYLGERVRENGWGGYNPQPAIATGRRAYPLGVPGRAEVGRALMRIGLGERRGTVGAPCESPQLGRGAAAPGRFCSAMPRCWYSRLGQGQGSALRSAKGEGLVNSGRRPPRPEGQRRS